jgi:hypothetical protein
MENRKLNRGAFIVAVAALAVSGALLIYSIIFAPDIQYVPPSVQAGRWSQFSSTEFGVSFFYPSEWGRMVALDLHPDCTTWSPEDGPCGARLDVEHVESLAGYFFLDKQSRIPQPHSSLEIKVYDTDLSAEDFIATSEYALFSEPDQGQFVGHDAVIEETNDSGRCDRRYLVSVGELKYYISFTSISPAEDRNTSDLICQTWDEVAKTFVLD